MTDTARYPEELSHTVTTTDGTRVFVRAIRPEDAERLIAFYDRLSEHTAYQRFFTVMKRLPPDWARMLANVDYVTRLALIAEAETPGGLELVAVARYEPTARADTAEVAFVVQDRWQDKGLGTMLLHDLLRAAQARGIRRFSAYVLAGNRRMLDLIGRFTTVVERKLDHGVVEATFTADAPGPPKRPRGPAVAMLALCGMSLLGLQTPGSLARAEEAPAAFTEGSRSCTAPCSLALPIRVGCSRSRPSGPTG
jgi:RimJ/RimL family protein N-acetyltransferase